MSWKNEVDKDLERRIAKERREREEREEMERKSRPPTENELKLQEHFEKFKCSYPNCKAKSSGPEKIWLNTGKTQQIRGSTMSGNSIIQVKSLHTKWDTPTYMYKCWGCGQWFCSVHIHKDKCQSCWGK